MDESPDQPFVTFSRRPGQGVVINDNVFIRILQVQGDKVEFEIVAPEGVPVYRGEDFAELKRRLREGGEGGEE